MDLFIVARAAILSQRCIAAD